MAIRPRLLFTLVVAAACLVACSTPRAQPSATDPPLILRVMTYNLWQGGDESKQSLEQTVKVIQAANADIVGLQETQGLAPAGQPRPDNALKIARMLGWEYLNQGQGTGIITRHRIWGFEADQNWAVIDLPGGRDVRVFNVHFAHAPYQPYQLLNIPYGDGRFITSEQEVIDEAKKARGNQVTNLLWQINHAQGRGWPTFITGDFNEPSHLDWTPRAAAAGKCPIAVEWPTTKAFAKVGFIDALRKRRPDEVNDRANTWTPITTPDDSKDRHDRIDFVLYRGNANPVKAELIGESPAAADIVVTPYPSDHRAVVVTFELTPR